MLEIGDLVKCRRNSAVTPTGANLFSYDPAGLLDQVQAGGTDFDNMLGRLSTEWASGGILRRYIYGPGSDEPLIWYEGAGTSDRRWLHADERGTVIAVTNDAGNSIGINTYDEFGIPGSANIGRFQYTGQKWIPELDVYDYKARMYSPTLGRFMQTDPIGYGDGMNWYAYAGNDPINRSDTSGTCGETQGAPCNFTDAVGNEYRYNLVGLLGVDGGPLNPSYGWVGNDGSWFNGSSFWSSQAPSWGDYSGSFATSSAGSAMPQSKPSSAPSECAKALDQPGAVAVDFGNGSVFAGIGGSLSVGYFRNLATGSNGFFITPGGGWGLQAGIGMQGGVYSSLKNLEGFNWSASAAVPSVSGSVNFAADGTPVGVTAGPGAKAGASFAATSTSLFMCNYYGK